MENIHINLLKTSFTIFVVAVCNSMCQSENTFNSEKTKLHKNRNVAEELFKRITSNDVGAKMPAHPARHTPSYLFHLFNALEEFRDLKQEHSGAYPKIKSFRGLKGILHFKSHHLFICIIAHCALFNSFAFSLNSLAIYFVNCAKNILTYK